MGSKSVCASPEQIRPSVKAKTMAKVNAVFSSVNIWGTVFSSGESGMD